MKGERAPTESSEYEASDDERKKRRGVSGGLGRGKVMKGEEDGKFSFSLSSRLRWVVKLKYNYLEKLVVEVLE